MPNANISIYLNDKDYLLYVDNKEDINEEARKEFKKILGRLK